MAYKTIHGTTNNQYIESAIDWDYTSDPATNNSTVTAKLYYRRTNSGYTTGGTGSFSITINGTTQSKSGVKLEISDTWVLAMSATVAVPHNPDGTKTITISATGSLPPSSLTETYCGATVTLDTIPRASVIGYAASVTLGNACDVRWTPLSASFRYRLKFTIGSWVGWSDIIHPNKTSAHIYNLYVFPLEVANQINKKTGTMTVTLYTYSDSGATSQIGSADTKTFTVTVPDNDATRPTVSMSLSPVSNLSAPSAPFNSLYIQGKSRVKATIGWSLKYGADAVGSSITVDGIVYGPPFESGYLTRDGVVSVKGLVIDSREHTGSCSSEITVIPYSKPMLQAASGEKNVIAARCDKDGKLSGSGTYLKIKAKIGYEKVISNGVQHNYGIIQYRWRSAGDTSYSPWFTILDCSASEGEEVTTEPLIGDLSIKTNYQVQIRAIDYLEEAEPVSISVPSENVYMHRPAGGKSMGLGGYSTGDGNLDVYWRTIARGGLSLLNAEGEPVQVDGMLPLPCGLRDWKLSTNNLANGVYYVDSMNSVLWGDSGNDVIMADGVLIQMAAQSDGYVVVQIALPTDTTFNPRYRIRWDGTWTPWNTFKN